MNRRWGAAATVSLLVLAAMQGGCSPASVNATNPAAERSPPLVVARGVVDQDGGLVRVVAQHDGVLDQVLVREGDVVAAHQPLATLDRRQAILNLQAAEAELSERRAQVEVARARMEGSQRDASRLRRLAEQDAGTRADAEQAATAARGASAEYTQAVAAPRSARVRVQLQALELDGLTVRAPVSGRVLRRNAVSGSFVTAASVLFVVEPVGPRIVRAEVDESFADNVRPGMSATITREFDEGRRLRGHVMRVAGQFGTSALSEDPTTPADSRIVEVIIAVDEQNNLRLGQRILVRFGP